MDKIYKVTNFTVTSKVNLPEAIESNLLDTQVSPLINKVEITNSKILYEGDLTINFIYSNSSNTVNSNISKIPFEFSIENPLQNEDITVDTRISAIGGDFNLRQNGDIDCTIDIECNIEFNKNMNINVIDNIIVNENDAISSDYDSLIIYIVQKGDTLWKIAKKFKSTIDDIAKVNEIQDVDRLEIGQKLYIPKFKYIAKNLIA